MFWCPERLMGKQRARARGPLTFGIEHDFIDWRGCSYCGGQHEIEHEEPHFDLVVAGEATQIIEVRDITPGVT